MINKLEEQTSVGVLWNFLEKLLSRGIGVLVTLLLAWFLVPEDYALIAMIAVFIMLSKVIVDGGLGQALIRKSDANDIDNNTVFYTNIFLSIIIYIILYLLAPFIADFYNQEILKDIIRVVGITVFFNAFIVVQQSLLQKKMLFKLQLKVHLPAAIISGILALLLAYCNFKVWALIAQIILNTFFVALFYWNLNIWRPSKKYSFHNLRELFSFGGFLIMESLFQVPFKNVYNIILPKFFATNIVGLYFFCEKIKELVSNQLVESIQTVTYPALSSIQHDTIRLKVGFKKVVLVISFILSIILLSISALAEPIFLIFFPSDWFEGFRFLQLIFVAAIMFPLSAININIMKVVGKSSLIFYTGLCKKFLGISIFIIALSFNDIFIVLYGQILLSILAFCINSYYAKKLISYSAYEQLLDFIPSLALSLLITALIYILQSFLSWNPLLEIIVFTILIITLYLMLASLFKLRSYKLAKEIWLKRLNKS